MQSHLNVPAFSAFIIELYERSEICDLLEIMHWFANQLSKLISFDSSWFGWSNLLKVTDFLDTENSGMEATILKGIPEEFFYLWKKMKSDDVIVRRYISTKKNYLTYSRMSTDQTDRMAEITDRYNIGEIAFAAVDTEVSSVSLVMICHRKSGKWKEYELQFMKAALAHAKISIERAFCQGGEARLLVDSTGQILVASSEARDFLRANWPDWGGNTLPRPLSGHGHEEQEGFSFQRYRATGFLGQNLHYLTVDKNSIAGRLTVREREVAEYVAKGLSYKEIAGPLQIAPATVRNHIRVAREKLGAKNKAALVDMVRGGSRSRA